MDISAILLNKILVESNLEVYGKLKLSFLDPAYSSVYSLITRHYDNYSNLPSFDELEALCRESRVQKIVATLRLTDDNEVSADVALDALIDQYTQNETIRLLDKFVDKLPVYDSLEIKENLAAIVQTLDEKTLKTEGVFAMNDIMVFTRPEELAKNRVHLGLNNTFDSVLGGVARQELILIGGKRGSGKSVTCSNLMINQYEMGNTSAYFTIEMIATETLTRNMSILANVKHMSLKNNKLTDDEMLKVVKARAGMFLETDVYVDEFLRHRDPYRFEEALVRNCALQEAQMVIVDDRALTIAALDLHLGKLKSRFGDKFTLAIVDYLNQIVVKAGSDQFDWKPQIVVSKSLKELARKHDVVIASPYQIDDNGETRFAKGILDAADIAVLMDPHTPEDNAISMETTKIRGAPGMRFTSPIEWDSLRISPQSIEKPVAPEKGKGKDKMKRAGKDSEEKAEDLPWN